jgi:hypothetical protein
MEQFTMSEENQAAGRKTISVPEAGRLYFGLERDAAYAAAVRGEIPVIRIGRTLRVPVQALDRILEQAGPWKAREAKGS